MARSAVSIRPPARARVGNGTCRQPGAAYPTQAHHRSRLHRLPAGLGEQVGGARDRAGDAVASVLAHAGNDDSDVLGAVDVAEPDRDPAGAGEVEGQQPGRTAGGRLSVARVRSTLSATVSMDLTSAARASWSGMVGSVPASRSRSARSRARRLVSCRRLASSLNVRGQAGEAAEGGGLAVHSCRRRCGGSVIHQWATSAGVRGAAAGIVGASVDAQPSQPGGDPRVDGRGQRGDVRGVGRRLRWSIARLAASAMPSRPARTASAARRTSPASPLTRRVAARIRAGPAPPPGRASRRARPWSRPAAGRPGRGRQQARTAG